MAEDNKFQNLDRLNRKLAKIPLVVRDAAAAALDSNAADLAALQRRLAPVEDGTLKDSIRVRLGVHELQVQVVAGGVTTTRPVRNGAKATYDYAVGQEFGTSEMPANPFFFPAYRSLRKKMRAKVMREARAAIKKAFSS